MSEEIEILLAAQGFHEMLGKLMETLDAEWISTMEGRMAQMERSILHRLVKLFFLNSFGQCCSFYIAIGPLKILVSFTYVEVEQLVLQLDLPKDFVCPQTR
jgi:hypothetical protein